MRIVQLIPGSGNTFYCENCLRDDTLAAALHRAGHDSTVAPMYLPLMTDEPGSPHAQPVFFGGVNVYLQQKFRLFRRTPRWIDRLFDSPRLLGWAARRAGMTDAEDLAETTLSMLRGADGRQVKELDRLVEWLDADARPDVVILSNALLVGLVSQIKRRLGCAVVCVLQDEHTFLDELPDKYRHRAWAAVIERCAEVDAFAAVSEYYAGVMRRRLKLPDERVVTIHPGVRPANYAPAELPQPVPTIGFLSRVCRSKGPETLLEAFAILKRDSALSVAKLRLAGGWTDADADTIEALKRRAGELGVADDVELLGNLAGQDRRDFLRSLSVLSVPAVDDEAFGIYIVEAAAAGVPVVQPATGAFNELIAATGGGKLVAPGSAEALADGLREVLTDDALAASLGRSGRRAVETHFNTDRYAAEMVDLCARAIRGAPEIEHG